jgi:hypothetical protein
MTESKLEPVAGFAERYNLHRGTPYRIIIAGTNPTDQATFDGVMTKLTVLADKDGFSIRELVLEKGLSWDDCSEKKPFKMERFGPPEDEENGYTLIGFGKINDPDGFFRARNRILKGGQ